MARLPKFGKSNKQNQLKRLLNRCIFGIREVEIASELGWHRRTVNNYLRILKKKGWAYKEGRSWFSDN